MDSLNRIAKCCLSSKSLVMCCILTAVSPIIFQSCELEPNLSKNIVEPHILNYDGFLLRGNSIFIHIGNYPVALPDAYGMCHFENVSFPYNLCMGRWNDELIVFNELHRKDPVITVPIDYYLWSRDRVVTVTVNFPPIERSKIGLVKFISKDLIDSLGWPANTKGIFKENFSSGTLEIRIPADKKSVTGKIIFLEGFGYFNGELLSIGSFNYYGQKDAVLKSNMENVVSFTQQEIGSNPPELPVSVSVTYPSGTYNGHTKVFLNFEDYCTNSKLLISQLHNYNGTVEVNVPILTNIEYNVMIMSYYDYRYYDRPYPFKIIEVKPGENCSIIHQLPVLLSPENNTNDVRAYDLLMVENNDEKGIYMFNIYTHNPFSKISILTDKNSLRLRDLNYWDYHILPNTDYEWSVTKFSVFNSIDDFTEVPYFFNHSFNSVSESYPRYFKTAPDF